ncbi:phage tail protein [uncultured Pseudodesulfovibrio sp.]|uniref:phage tail protein n=1 Tax=uncultured Pseudodesulfovibrio sp. TaxID=2035858 RepID=UPI0029C656DA|nr:phage tail protein [uncultured Pseudodesulfovibrio sp.]
MIQTFIPPKPPSFPLPVKTTARVKSISFGDGYSQGVADGLNAIYDAITITWKELTLTQVVEIDTFLRAHEGTRPFYWTHPSKNIPQKWVCRTWTPDSTQDNRHTLTANFMEDFSLDD